MENTGLLDPEGDVPTSIREGLADFLENRPPTGRFSPGRPNTGKIATLLRQRSTPWIPVSRLLSDEKLFEEIATIRLAEAESWVMVDHLIRSPARLPGFLRYLEATNAHRDSDHRLEDAQTHLGDLDQLDKDLQAAAAQWRTYFEKLPATQKTPRE